MSKVQGFVDVLRSSLSACRYTKIGSRHRLSRKQVQHYADSFTLCQPSLGHVESWIILHKYVERKKSKLAKQFEFEVD